VLGSVGGLGSAIKARLLGPGVLRAPPDAIPTREGHAPTRLARSAQADTDNGFPLRYVVALAVPS